MINFTRSKRPFVDIMDELSNLERIDEEYFEGLKIDFLKELKNGKRQELFITPLEKIAYMEAYIEHYSKYPLSISMFDIHKNLTSKDRIKLTKLLSKIDFNHTWTKREYRKFIFKYYAITRGAEDRPWVFSNFSEEVKKFIFKRIEQQVLMDHFVQRGPVVSKIKARIKMTISFIFNVSMLSKVGAFYSFYEIKLFSPSDEIIDKIYKHGFLNVKDEIISQYKIRAGIEVTYNEIRPYMVLAGMSGVAASNYFEYEQDHDYFKKMKDEYKELISSGIGKVYYLLGKDERIKLSNHMEEEYNKSLKKDDSKMNHTDKQFLRDTLLK